MTYYKLVAAKDKPGYWVVYEYVTFTPERRHITSYLWKVGYTKML